MTRLNALRNLLEEKYSDRQSVILAPYRDSLLPQSHDASILRAIFYPIPVLSESEIDQKNEFDLIMKLLPVAKSAHHSRPRKRSVDMQNVPLRPQSAPVGLE